jgi:hypothetical protein
MRYVLLLVAALSLVESTADVSVDQTLLADDEERASADLLLPKTPRTEQHEAVESGSKTTWANATIIQSDEQSESVAEDRTLKKKKKKKKNKNNNKADPNVLFIMTDQHRFDAIGFIQDEMRDFNGKTKVRIQRYAFQFRAFPLRVAYSGMLIECSPMSSPYYRSKHQTLTNWSSRGYTFATHIVTLPRVLHRELLFGPVPPLNATVFKKMVSKTSPPIEK